MASKPNKKQGTTDRWKDSLGQEFKPGDMVAVAVINGRSPQMVVALVERINTTNAKGEPHTKNAWTGEMKGREIVNRTYTGPEIPEEPGRFTSSYFRPPAEQRAYQAQWNEWRRKKEELEADPANWRIDRTWTYWEEVTEKVPTVTVTAKPVLDGRGFYRSGTRRKGSEKEPPELDLSQVKSVTYMFIGNIVKLPGHLTLDEVLAIARRPVEYPPSWGW